jgi:hypothetical protein
VKSIQIFRCAASTGLIELEVRPRRGVGTAEAPLAPANPAQGFDRYS